MQKQVLEGQALTTTDYLSGFQYLDGKLDFIPHSEGYVKVVNTGSTTAYHYVYNYTDYLGNIRLRYTVDSETNELAILEKNNYYPFGLTHKGYNSDHRIMEIGQESKVHLIPVTDVFEQEGYHYKFNVKELQPELGLNWHDYHAHNYDAALSDVEGTLRWVGQESYGKALDIDRPVGHFFFIKLHLNSL